MTERNEFLTELYDTPIEALRQNRAFPDYREQVLRARIDRGVAPRIRNEREV